MPRINTKLMRVSADEMHAEAADAMLSGSGVLAERMELAERFLREAAKQLDEFYKNEDEFQKHFVLGTDALRQQQEVLEATTKRVLKEAGVSLAAVGPDTKHFSKDGA